MFALSFSTIIFLSCSDDWEEPYLNISDSEISVSSSGEQVLVPIETNSHWRVLSSLPSWVTMEQTEGDNSSELVIDVASNSSFQRICKLVVAANAVTKNIKLTQAASTSGTLSVTTGDCTVTGFFGKYTLTFDFTVKNPHLASEAGIMVGNNKYPCETLGSYCFVQVSLQTLNPYGGTYQAYAYDKVHNKYVYGKTKTITEQ